jgi:hypothetical protein
MKINIKIILLSVLTGGFVSCGDYLDVVPDNIATIDYAFRNRTACEKYLFTCYSYMPRMGTISEDPAIAAGDETWMLSSVGGWASRRLAQGEQSITSPIINFWNGENGASSNLWIGIRDCNIFLENVDKVFDLPAYEKKRWIAEVKFLKAYYHFHLFKMYGPIPIVDVNTPISGSPDEVKPYREPVDDVVNYIVDLLDEAAADLPLERDVVEGTEAGRANNLIAKSTRAKVLVYAASKLFNGNTDYANIIDGRGVRLFPQEYDLEKWRIAAEACREAIEICHAQNKRLYDLIEPALTLQNDTFQLQTMYRQAICDRWNSELIWGGTNYNCTELSQQAQGRIMRLAGDNLSVRTEWGPTLKIVERYYSERGVPINEDVDWVNNKWYENRYKVRPEPSSGKEKFLVKEGQRTVYLHYNRDPRFYASIGFDRGIYFGNGYNDFPENVKHLEFRVREQSGMSSSHERFSITGYCVKKMHSYKNAMTTTLYSVEYYPFPVIRLADLYLLYAEALNEYGGPSEEVFHYLDLVRNRVKLEGVRESWRKYSVNPEKPNSQDGLRDIIHQERTIELAFEGERFWDILRWKKISEFNEQPMGWNTVYGETEEDFYRVTPVAQKPVQFSVKDYLWPIKEYELSVNKKLVQNYGW